MSVSESPNDEEPCGRRYISVYLNNNQIKTLLDNNQFFTYDEFYVFSSKKKKKKYSIISLQNDAIFGRLHLIPKQIYSVFLAHPMRHVSIPKKLSNVDLGDRSNIETEIRNNVTLSKLFALGKTPHVQLTFSGKIDDHSSDYFIVQKCDNTLAKMGQIMPQNELGTYVIFVLLILEKLQSECKFVHNDLFSHCIYLQKVRESTRWCGKNVKHINVWKYARGKGHPDVYMNRPFFIVKLGELGFSSCFSIDSVRSDIVSGKRMSLGMLPYYSPQYDIMCFLLDMHETLKCSLSNQLLCQIAKDWKYESLTAMLDDIVLRSHSTRIKPGCLEGLDATYILDRYVNGLMDVYMAPPSHATETITMQRIEFGQ